MTVEELIEILHKFPKDAIVYRDQGDYEGDYVEVESVGQLNAWEFIGVEIH